MSINKPKGIVVRTPLMSVVVPVYNVEEHLAECIESVISQDIGFQGNIELILIDDGSTDGSTEICERYRVSYPDNVIFVTQKNSGASKARNVGVEYAKGQYIGFLDSDDRFSPDAISSVLSYFETAPKEVEVAIIKTINFGAHSRVRHINKVFDQGTHTEDLRDPKWFSVCPRVSPSFIRASVAKQYQFKEGVGFFEDTRYLNEILYRSMLVGIVAEGEYYYRRFDENDIDASVCTGATSKVSFYLHSSKEVSLYLLEMSAGEEGPPLYFQFLALYEMRWRLFYNNDDPKQILSSEDYEAYCEINNKIVSYLSDAAIFRFGLFSVWQKMYILNLKYGRNILEEVTYSETGMVIWRDHTLFNAREDLIVKIRGIDINNDTMTLEGHFIGVGIEHLDIFAQVDGERFKGMQIVPNMKPVTDFYLDGGTYKYPGFRMEVVLGKEIKKIDFAFTSEGVLRKVKKVGILLTSRKKKKPLYLIIDKYIARRYENCITVSRVTPKSILELGAVRLKWFFKRW